MFGSRRHRPPSQPLTAATANPNAATAAASAFTRQASPSSLSSAAAAAALRARPHTPTNVSEVQTRRTRRRSASVSSVGSRDGGNGLKRSLSAGSMSERSLRPASPHRSAAHGTAEQPPPVPSIPDLAVPRSNGDARGGNKRRAASHTQPSNARSEPMKEGHTSWSGSPLDPQYRIRTSCDSDARPRSSGSSINFSYPRGARVTSPAPKSPPADKAGSRFAPTPPSTAGSAQELVYDPNSRRMVPKSEVLALERSMMEPRRKSTRRKKKKGASAPSGDSGAGSVAKHEEPAAEPEKPTETRATFEAPELVTGRMYEDMGAELFVERKAGENESQGSNFGPEVHVPAIPDTYHEGAATLFRSREVLELPRYNAYRPPTAPVHETAEDAGHHRDASKAVDPALVRASTHAHNREAVELPTDRFEEPSPVESPAQSSAEPDKIGGQDPKETPASHHKTVSIARTDKLSVPVRHSPPPRSTSPIKSALKHPVGSNRTSSISDHGSEGSTDVMHQQFDPAAARKKSFRVSFDDESVVVGDATTEIDTSGSTQAASSSPSTKKRWYSLSRRRDSGASIGDDEVGEVMKPRPMLPSFGSVREKKAKSHEERPLVRPYGFTNSTLRPTQPAVLPTIPSDPDLGEPGAGLSSDHAIGTALTMDLAHRHEANISRLREPLPPQVTSVEGDGFMSDSSSGASLLSSDDEELLLPSESSWGGGAGVTPTSAVPGSEKTTVTGKGAGDDVADAGLKPEPRAKYTASSVPQIAVSSPSPQPKEEDILDSPHSSESDEFFDLPGTFPDNGGAGEETPSSWNPPQLIKSLWQGTKSEPEDVRSQAPNTLSEEATRPQMPKPGPSHDLPSTVEEETEDSGIFSDAYEDLSDVEGDGFQSLDAVADGPAMPGASQKTPDMAVTPIVEDTRSAKQPTTASDPAKNPGPVQVMSEKGPDMDWEQAKAYWRSLSAEKRKQLELEAMREAGEEADLDESRINAKPKTKRAAKREQYPPDHEPLTGPSTKTSNVGQAGRFLRKTLRGPHPASSDVESVSQSQPEKPGRLMSLRSPPPAGPSEVASEGGMRRTLRTQRSPDATPTESPRSKEKRRLSLQFPTPSLGLPRKLKAKPNRRPMSSGDNPQNSGPTDWTASPPQGRGSFSSESSFRRVTPRLESSGFRKTLRSDPSSPGMVPGSSAGRMGSFSLTSSDRPHGTFRRNSSLRSSPSASPASRMRDSLRKESGDGSSRYRRFFSFGGFSQKGGKQRARDLDDSSDEDVPTEVLPSPTARGPATANGTTLTKAAPAQADETSREEYEDLSDSDSEPNQPSAVAPVETAPTTSLNANESLSHSYSGRGLRSKPDRKGKGGLMSALRRRKADHGRISRPERMESAARRDTKLERSAAELEALRSPTPGQGHHDEDSDSVDVALPSPRRRLEKRGGVPAGTGVESLEGKKKKLSAFRRVFKLDE